MTLVEEYLSYTKKWKAEYGEKTLVLMQVGSFFEVYALIDPNGKMVGSNIQDFASINDMVISRKSQCVGNQQVMMAGFGIAQSEKYLKKLQEAGYTIAVYTQDAQTKNTTRSLSEIISPGTYFSQDSVELSNNILCIWLHKSKSTTFTKSQMTIGVSNIDVYTGKTSVSQFTSDYNHIPSTYDDLERYVSVYKPNECILISNLSLDQLNDIVEYAGIKCQTIHKLVIDTSSATTYANSNQQTILNAEKQIYQREIIKRFFPSITEETFQSFTTHYIAIQSLSFLLDFAYKHSPYLVRNLSEPVFENHTNKLLLANHSLKQLNMIDDSRHNGRLSSVYSLLNHCVTNMGKRSFIQILHNPTTCIEQLQRSYDITDHLLNNDSWKFYREKMIGLKDMEKFNRKLVYKKVSPKDLSMFVDDLQKVLTIYREIKKDTVLCKHISSGSVESICNEMIDHIQSKFSLQKCIQIEDISIERLLSAENDVLSFINTGVSVEIDKCQKATIDSREKWDAIQLTFSNMIAGIEKSSKTASSAFIKSHETPKSIPLMVATKRRMALLKSQITSRGVDKMMIKYMSNHTKKEETYELSLSDLEYTEYGGAKKDMTVCNKQIKEMANEIQNSKDKWIQEISLFYSIFIEEFMKKYKDSIENIQRYIAEVDTICCKCYIANTYNYCKPVISNTHVSSYFSCTGLRHPLIEHLQTRELYVTNDLTMTSVADTSIAVQGTSVADTRSDSAVQGTSASVQGTSASGILLYGTNAVGKTSFIKSIGIAIILAQAGLYVPCSTFTYYPYKSIFTRILGNDNIFKGLSTFAVEMSELRTILEQSDENSIVLGDELCSGTESHSALSIFTAGLEILHEKKCTFLFATHFHEIVSYDEIKKLDRMKCMHMAVKYVPEKGVLVYDRKLRDGPGDSMYGLEVCKSLNLPKTFLQRAHDIRIKYNPNASTILTDKTSHYNKKKIVGMCEMCNEERSTEVHHLAHQKNASIKNDYIDSFHKNHPANLMSICESCHKKFHDSDNNVNHRLKKTTSGQTIVVISS